MTKIYVANYMDLASYEAEQDSPSARDMALIDFASPQVSHVLRDLTQGSIDVVLRACRAEYMDLMEGSDETPKLSWKALGMRTAKRTAGRDSWAWVLVDGETEVAIVVVQEMEVV